MTNSIYRTVQVHESPNLGLKLLSTNILQLNTKATATVNMMII